MAPGARLHWRESGSGPATLLLVHGYPLSSAIWDAQLEAVPAGWRFLAPDLPGLGDSPPPPTLAPTMDDYADELAAFMDERGVVRAVVCGLSMGGYAAFRLWARHRARIAGLVLTHTRALPDTPAARLNRQANAQRAQEEGVAPLVEAMLPKLVGPATLAGRPEVVDKLRRIMMESSVAGVVAALGAMAERPDSTSLLPQIDVPTLVVAGGDDSFAPPAEMRMLAQSIAGAEFVVVPGVAHLSCMEDPASFNTTLTHFLARIHTL